jgi:multidrug resistance efflux pump
MELILLLIYSFFVWLIFFKFKWLPWNITSQVIVITIPIIGIAFLILMLNIAAPSSSDVRVINYVVQVVPRVTGRVIEVPVEPNRPIKKGDVLFRIDPKPFELTILSLETKLPEFEAKLASANAYNRELVDQVQTARSQKAAIAAKLGLAKQRLEQTKELAEKGAGPRYDYEQADAELKNLEAEFSAATSTESQIQQKLSARSNQGDLSEVAQVKAQMAQVQAQLAEARWQLEQTVFYAPADGTIVNLQLRPGSYAAAIPLSPVMSFVENEQWLVALYHQNELRKIKAGNEAEVTLETHPNQIIKCKVDSIVWASGQGQMPISGRLPETGAAPVPEGRFAVRLMLDGKSKGMFLAAGARGHGAVYTDWGAMIHIVRKAFLRVSTKMDWLILKLH